MSDMHSQMSRTSWAAQWSSEMDNHHKGITARSMAQLWSYIYYTAHLTEISLGCQALTLCNTTQSLILQNVVTFTTALHSSEFVATEKPPKQ